MMIDYNNNADTQRMKEPGCGEMATFNGVWDNEGQCS
jgi:hypothetical protein